MKDVVSRAGTPEMPAKSDLASIIKNKLLPPLEGVKQVTFTNLMNNLISNVSSDPPLKITSFRYSLF